MFKHFPATEVGGIWLIKQSDLDLVKDRKPGRPKKKQEEE